MRLDRRTLASLALLVLIAPARVALAQAPDAESLARLADRLGAARSVRVRTPHGAWTGRTVRLSADGVGLAGTARFGEVAVEPPQRALVPWANVTTIETRRGLAGRGMLIGTAVGLVVGALIASNGADEPRTGSANSSLAMGFSIAGGFMIGTALGSASDPWVRAWPEAR